VFALILIPLADLLVPQIDSRMAVSASMWISVNCSSERVNGPVSGESGTVAGRLRLRDPCAQESTDDGFVWVRVRKSDLLRFNFVGAVVGEQL
jgi:hypothetical protein